MFNNGQISSFQLKVLVFFFTIGGAIIFIPSLSNISYQDSWIGYLIGAGIGILFVLIYTALANLYPNMSIMEFSQEILGVGVGKVVSILYFTYFFHCTAYFLRQLGEFMKVHIFVETPIQAVYFIFFTIIIMGIRSGLETFARASEIFYPVILVLLFVFFVFIFPDVEITNIQPLLEYTKELPKTIYYSLDSPYLQLVTFLMILPCVVETKKNRSFFIGTISGAFVLFMVILCSLLVLGVYNTSNQQYATYIMARKISIGGFLERIEVLIALIWFVALYFKITIFFYAANLSLTQILNLKEYRSLTYPLAIIAIVYAIISVPNLAYLKEFEAKITTLHHLTFGLLLPLVLLVVGKIKKRFIKQK